MFETTTPETHIASKRFFCSWCAEPIEPGTSYVKWRCFDVGDANTCRLHEECRAAMDKAYAEDPWGMTEGFAPGDHKRGKTE